MARATVVIRLTPKQAEIVWLNTDGWIDAGCCKDGLHPGEREALSSVRDQISQQIHKRRRRSVRPAPPASSGQEG